MPIVRESVAVYPHKLEGKTNLGAVFVAVCPKYVHCRLKNVGRRVHLGAVAYCCWEKCRSALETAEWQGWSFGGQHRVFNEKRRFIESKRTELKTSNAAGKLLSGKHRMRCNLLKGSILRCNYCDLSKLMNGMFQARDLPFFWRKAAVDNMSAVRRHSAFRLEIC